MSGKPAFTFCDFAGAASVTATDTLSGTDPNNVLLATEDTVWSPADAVANKELTIDLVTGFGYDHTSFLGEDLDGLEVGVLVSNDNFVSDSELFNDVIINGDFATGDLTGWVIDTEIDMFITASVSGVLYTAPDPFPGDAILRQDSVITPNVFYLVQYTIVSISGDAEVRPSVGDNFGLFRTTAGTFREIIKAGSASNFKMHCNSTSQISTALVTDIKVTVASVLSTTNNAAILDHGGLSSKRYIKYLFGNPSTSLQIAHICPDTLVEQPFLENDWGSEGVSPTFNNLISTGGLFLGNNQVRTMRDISIEFGEVTGTEFINTVKPWVDSRIKVAKPFFFIPDVNNLDEIYFVWLEDNVGFTAPLRQGIRTVAPIAAKTRIE